jgi:hypothetical protein
MLLTPRERAARVDQDIILEILYGSQLTMMVNN